MQDSNEQFKAKSEAAIDLVMISDEAERIKESLSDFFLEWVQSEDEADLKERRAKVFHYKVLMEMLSHVEELQEMDD